MMFNKSSPSRKEEMIEGKTVVRLKPEKLNNSVNNRLKGKGNKEGHSK
jgi:hypothetical protein